MNDLVKKLYRRFKTTDPFRIAKGLNIKIITAPLLGVRGYYHYFRRNHYIYLADALDEAQRTFICAHELAHYLFHRRINTVFMDRYTFCPKNKYENEANAFAVALLTYNIDLSDYDGYCKEKVLLSLGVPTDVAKLR
ncbi:hypothetical protein SDC9_127352 [bioreactor metagenome]|uniref:IrrE N-terminal-like domain-containing protein n=1 Tax=bioreactor metagenome TaxID=1076179 RepID=A0A645CTU1_9ZZZZ